MSENRTPLDATLSQVLIGTWVERAATALLAQPDRVEHARLAQELYDLCATGIRYFPDAASQ